KTTPTTVHLSAHPRCAPSRGPVGDHPSPTAVEARADPVPGALRLPARDTDPEGVRGPHPLIPVAHLPQLPTQASARPQTARPVPACRAQPSRNGRQATRPAHLSSRRGRPRPSRRFRDVLTRTEPNRLTPSTSSTGA